jgi:hypothetical protein
VWIFLEAYEILIPRQNINNRLPLQALYSN